MGNVYERLGQYEQAIRCERGCLAIFRQIGDRHMHAHGLTSLGRVYHRQGRHAEAIRCHSDSLAIFRDVGNRQSQAEALRDLGDALLGIGHADQARGAWREALQICQAIGAAETGEIRSRLDSLGSAGGDAYGRPIAARSRAG